MENLVTQTSEVITDVLMEIMVTVMDMDMTVLESLIDLVEVALALLLLHLLQQLEIKIQDQ